MAIISAGCRMLSAYWLIACAGTMGGGLQQPKEARKAGEWPVYAGDLASTKYSPLSQINRDNVRNLQVAWTWESPDNALTIAHPTLKPGPNESTPLMIGGVLYTPTSLNQVAAIDAVTGKTLWLYDPKDYGGVHRGVAYWENGKDRRIVYATKGWYLRELDAATGKPIPSFGTNGGVDLTLWLRRGGG